MNALTVNLKPVLELTDEQFFQLCQANRDLRFERTATGELIIMPGEDVLQGFILNLEAIW